MYLGERWGGTPNTDNMTRVHLRWFAYMRSEALVRKVNQMEEIKKV